MKRKLCTLRQHARQDQQKRNGLCCNGQFERIELRQTCASNRRQVDKTQQHWQGTADRHDQGLLSGSECIIPLIGIGINQEERAQAGEFPESEQYEQVVGQDQAQHRSLEQRKCGDSTPALLRRPEIGTSELHDEDTDEGDKRRDGQRTLVQAPREDEVKLRRPLPQNVNALDLCKKQPGNKCKGQPRGPRSNETGMRRKFTPGEQKYGREHRHQDDPGGQPGLERHICKHDQDCARARRLVITVPIES